MNALQYWIIDGFIKDPSGGETHYQQAAGDESDEDSDDDAWLDRHRRSREQDDDDTEAGVSGPLKEANPTAVPVRNAKDYDPEIDGAQGSSSKKRVE